MRSLNKAMLIGNVGKDPDTNFTTQGVKVSRFSVATSERWTDKEGTVQEHTDWHTIVAWRSVADIVEKYVHKGSRIYVEGKISTRSYDDQEGNKKYVTEIVAESIILMDSKKLSNSSDHEHDGGANGESQVSDEIPF